MPTFTAEFSHGWTQHVLLHSLSTIENADCHEGRVGVFSDVSSVFSAFNLTIGRWFRRGYHVVQQTVFLRFSSGHKKVAICIFGDLLHVLSRVLRIEFVELFSQANRLASANIEIRRGPVTVPIISGW